jgi:homoserine kinase type II
MLSAGDVARILAHYEVGSIRRVAAAPHGFVNETAVVDTDDGRFVVRRTHRRFSIAAQERRHMLMARAAAYGAPTAPLITTRDGRTLLVIDGRGCEVQRFVVGADFDPQRPRQLDSIGRTLAQYHCAVADCAALAEPAPPRYAPQRIGALVEVLLERDVMGELHEPLAWYAARASALRARLDDTAYGQLPQTVIHGDIHPDNLLFNGDSLAALLDFDQATVDARLVDLADALVSFCSVKESAGGWGVFRGPLDPAAAARLCAAYAAAAPLTPAERSALPVLIETLWLVGELGRVISTPEGSPEYHQGVLAQGMRLSATLSPNQTSVGF